MYKLYFCIKLKVGVNKVYIIIKYLNLYFKNIKYLWIILNIIVYEFYIYNVYWFGEDGMLLKYYEVYFFVFEF